MIMSVMVLFPLLPEIRAELGASYSEISVIVASLGLVRLLLAIPSGFIADRYGKKKLLVWSALIAVAHRSPYQKGCPARPWSLK